MQLPMPLKYLLYRPKRINLAPVLRHNDDDDGSDPRRSHGVPALRSRLSWTSFVASAGDRRQRTRRQAPDRGELVSRVTTRVIHVMNGASHLACQICRLQGNGAAVHRDEAVMNPQHWWSRWRGTRCRTGAAAQRGCHLPPDTAAPQCGGGDGVYSTEKPHNPLYRVNSTAPAETWAVS